MFPLQFKTKRGIDKTENTAGRPFPTEEAARAGSHLINLAFSLRPTADGPLRLLTLARPLPTHPHLTFKYPWHINYFLLKKKEKKRLLWVTGANILVAGDE